MQIKFGPLLEDMFTRSHMLYLDFATIPASLPDLENMRLYFEERQALGIDPKLPEERQRFNEAVLQTTGARYLIGGWGEDRSSWLKGSKMEQEGRTIHLALDVFSKGLEPVFTPCDGEVVVSAYEDHLHGYGNYIIIKPSGVENLYMLLGHLSANRPALGPIKAGQTIARLGDYVNQENGGWSRHVHVQLLTELPPERETPIGYSTQKDFEENSKKFPNPLGYFQPWKIQKQM